MRESFNGIEIDVTPTGDTRHWFMTLDSAAEGYGTTLDAVYKTLQRHGDEIRDGVERGGRIVQTLGGQQQVTVLYREGVIKLGFFVRSKRAAAFRQWATDLLVAHLDQHGLDLRDVLASIEGRFDRVDERFDSLQGEVDELRALIHVTLSDADEKEIRKLFKEVKEKTGMDGRSIAGHVRKTLGTSGVYNTPNLMQVKNVLRNLLGYGVKGSV